MTPGGRAGSLAIDAASGRSRQTFPPVRRRAGAGTSGRAASVIALCLALDPAAAAHAYEREPVLDAATLVSPSLLSGPGWSVAPQAQVVGYQARFTLRTPYGEVQAESVEMLALRVAELPAVEALHAATASEVFARSAAAAVEAQGRAAARVARDPLRTLARLPQGVARYFGARLRGWGERARKLGDKAGRRIFEQGDPYDDVDAAMSAARGEPVPRRWHDRPRKEALNLVKGELDFGRARRAWARRLGIDPQTTNPLLRPRLDALSWMAVGGTQAAGVGMASIGGTAVELLDAGGRVHAAVWELDPPDLRARNRARLSRWCHDGALLHRFLRHKAFNAQLQTALAETTRALQPSRGCDALLETALMAGTEQEARFVVNALSLLRHYLGSRAHGGELRPVGATLAFLSRDGELLLPLAVDHLSWTGQMHAFFAREAVAHAPRTLLVTGAISLRAQRELTARGWSLVPHLPYPGAPPYSPSPASPTVVPTTGLSAAG